MTIYLVGFMMAGKTSVGRHVALELGRPFVDLDQRIEQRAGRSVADIFRELGEERFRDLEEQALRSIAGDPVVVATGGGAPERAQSRDLMLKTGFVLWLRSEFAVIWIRGRGGSDVRPLWQNEENLHKLFERRQPLYSFAHRSVDAASGSVPEIAHQIASIAREREMRR